MSEHQIEYVDIDSIEPHPDNARKGDVTAIAESLTRFGQTKPLIVQANTRYVLAGNHTREAAKSLGWPKVAVVLLDLNDEDARGYLLGDNRTSDRASYDQEQLYANLEQMLDLEGTGFDMDYVETLADALGSNVVAGTDTGDVKHAPTPDAKPAGETTKPDRKRAADAEPMRDVILLMPQSEARAFGENVGKLQKAYGTRTVVATVQQAIAEAVATLGDAA